MQYHALSLCQQRGDFNSVHLIGYSGARVIPELEAEQQQGRLVISAIRQAPEWIQRGTKVLKALHQAFMLLFMMLFWLPSPDLIILQIPPAIPTMLLCIIAAKIRRARLVFDWHNFAHTLMSYGSSSRKKSILVRIARAYERFLAPYADGHLCVTKQMKKVLREEYRNTNATVFYDKPPSLFHGRSTQDESLALFETLEPCLRNPMHIHDCISSLFDRHNVHDLRNGLFCIGSDGGNQGAPRPCRVLVSSTSWTPDEDFGVLLDAMVAYDKKAQKSRSLPLLLLFVTGRGPQKEFYIEKMKELDLRHVAIRTVWLEPKDYPVLLGSADLGISLHASSSGVDLPMKVVDMFGSQLPVCALRYPCIADEMVHHAVNGLLFSTSIELADQLEDLFQPEDSSTTRSKLLRQLSNNLIRHPYGDWDTEWKTCAWPVLIDNLSQVH
jgi:beta-1,4-mannosyltransferase